VIEIREIAALGDELLGEHMLFKFHFSSVARSGTEERQRDEQGAVHKLVMGLVIYKRKR
jgi:hypothetical protein